MLDTISRQEKNLIIKSSLMGFTAATLLTPVAWAQEESAREEIVVTALRRESTLQDAPAAVSAFSADTIERANITRAEDFVSKIPNATLINTNTEGEAFFVLRGMAPARNGETSTAVVVDGVLATGPNELNRDLYNIKSIEVLKGPQGALYGRNAVAGAIVINTKPPTNDLEARIKVGLGEEGRELVSGAVSMPLIEDKLFTAVSLQSNRRGGKLKNIFTGEERDRFKRQSLNAHLKFLPSDNLTIDLRGYLTRVRDAGGINAVAVFADPAVGLDVNDKLPRSQNNIKSFDEQDKYGGSLKIDFDIGDIGTLTSTTAYNFTENSYGQDNFPYFYGDTHAQGGAGQTQWVLFNYETLSQEFRFSSDSEGPFNYLAGIYVAEITSDRVTNLAEDTHGVLLDGRHPNLGTVNTTTVFRDDETERTNVAAFLNVSYEVTEQLTLTAAVRYDDESAENTDKAPAAFTPNPGLVQKADYTAWQPKFTIAYEVNDDLNLFANWGKGFKAGGFNPFGTGAAVRAANPLSTVVDDYEEETSESFDLGFKARLWDNRVQLNAAIFYTEVENAQSFSFFPGPSLQAIAQVEEVDIQGFELDFIARPTDNLMISAGYGYTDLEIKKLVSNPSLEGNWMPYVPKDTINAAVEYEHRFNEDLALVTRVDYTRIGNTWFNLENFPGTERDPVGLVDVRIALEAEKWTLAFWSKNATDEHYQSEPVIILPFIAATFRGAPSYWGADFTYRF